MSGHAAPAEYKGKFFTPGVYLLLLIMALGAVFGAIRYIYGLHAVTNFSNTFPWGIWKAVNVAAVAAAGSSGFTMTAIVHVFHKEEYHSIMRPSLVVAILCYSFVGVALLVDIGKYYDIWHPMMPGMWQVNSALFEVAMCVMCYLTVLYIEFAPVAFERFIGRLPLIGPLKKLEKPLNFTLKAADSVLGRTMSLFMLLGIVLCCLHQSTLGTLMIIPAYKMHALWFTPALPLLFLLSATAVGLASAVAAYLWSAKAFGFKADMQVISSLSRSIPIFIGIYAAARIIDLALRDRLSLMFDGSARSTMFMVEFFVGVVLPGILIFIERVRRSPVLLFWSCALFILGVTFNRINTYLTAYTPLNTTSYYFPAPGEIAICIAQIAAIIFLFRLIVAIFPVIPGATEEPPR